MPQDWLHRLHSVLNDHSFVTREQLNQLLGISRENLHLHSHGESYHFNSAIKRESLGPHSGWQQNHLEEPPGSHIAWIFQEIIKRPLVSLSLWWRMRLGSCFHQEIMLVHGEVSVRSLGMIRLADYHETSHFFQVFFVLSTSAMGVQHFS